MREWFKAAGIRALRTAAQVGVILVGSDIVNIVTLDWLYILGCMAAGAVASMFTSVAGIPEVDDGKSPITTKHKKAEDEDEDEDEDAEPAA